MHYDGLLNGLFDRSNPIIKDAITGEIIGTNRKMSKLDIQKLNEMYPCKQSNPVCGKYLHIFSVYFLDTGWS